MVMDSRALLDYALFQLTPTRTRCDLVIVSGKKNEKIASGLLEPFLSHLKSAKDEISKGGYSITLKPPSENSPWFTKATLERFVRFVSTPEVLERFVTIEREIDQIERSNEQANGTLEALGSASATDGDPKFPIGQSKSKYESHSSSNAETEENPKIRLQRVLESRKTMLKKEQAMAYARALVAGFEMDDMHDLVSFGDAFGALRLREACVNFMELCNKKNGDKIWMDEVAAMQASYLGAPGIILTGENNELSQTGITKSSTSDSITRHGSADTSEGTENALPGEFNPQQTEGTAQMPAWPHYLPHYMQNTRGGPVFQQMPLYPGYGFPGMPHYPGNVPWHMNFHESGGYTDRDFEDSHRYKSSVKRRDKTANHARPHSTSNGESIESDASSSQSDQSDRQDQEQSLSSWEDSHSKKHGRRSSKKVVIRNINYITSSRNEDSSSASDSREDNYVDADTLKQQVEAAVGSLKRHQKPNNGRDRSNKDSNKPKIDFDNKNGGTADHAEEKKNGNWDIFQNLLMRDSASISTDTDSKNVLVQEEYSVQKGIGEENLSLRKLDRLKYGSDDFILTERSAGNGTEKAEIKFEGAESFRGLVRSSSKDEALLIPPRVEGEYYLQNAHLGAESSIIKSRKEVDPIVGSKLETSGSAVGGTGGDIFRGDQLSTKNFQCEENKRDVLLDDSFMVRSRLSDGPSHNQAKADIVMVSDILGANEPVSSALGNTQGKVETGNYNEPEDLYMMLRHDSAPEQRMDYGIDISLVETDGNLRSTEQKDNADTALVRSRTKSNIRNSKKPGGEVDRKAPKPKALSGYLGRSKSDITSRSRMPTTRSTMARGSADKEDEKRKKTEELLLQRQKRIAERSAAKGIALEGTKISSKESMKNSVSAKVDKAKLQPSAEENKMLHKPVMKSSTIDRLAAPRTASKQLLTESKVGQNRKLTSKGSSVRTTPSIKKSKVTREKQDKVDPLHKNGSATNNSEDASSGIQENVPEESTSAEGTSGINGTDDFGAVKVFHAVTSVEKRETSVISAEDALDDKKSVPISSDKDLFTSEDPSKQAIVHTDANDCAGVTQMTGNLAVGNNLKSNDMNVNEKGEEKKKISFSPQISVMNISTPPPEGETSPELIHSRKKWYNGEGSPKVPKGFRKLLLFGRRS